MQQKGRQTFFNFFLTSDVENFGIFGIVSFPGSWMMFVIWWKNWQVELTAAGTTALNAKNPPPKNGEIFTGKYLEFYCILFVKLVLIFEQFEISPVTLF